MRVGSVSPSTGVTFQPSSKQQQNQNGHAVNFGDLKRPMEELAAELAKVKGVKEALERIYSSISDCLQRFAKEPDLLVDVKDGVVKAEIIGDSNRAKSYRDYSQIFDDLSNLDTPEKLSGAVYSIRLRQTPKGPSSHPYDEIYDWNIECEKKDMLRY